MKKLGLLVCVLSLLTFSEVAWAQDDSGLTLFLAADSQRVERMEDLPARVQAWVTNHLRERSGTEFPPKLANPDEPFQMSDAVDPRSRLPWRRLIFAGETANSAFLYYVTGGFAPHELLAVFDLSCGKTEWVYSVRFSRQSLESIADLKAFIAKEARNPDSKAIWSTEKNF